MKEATNRSLQELADYKYALDLSTIVTITDSKGIIKYANDNFCTISKYSREELLGKNHNIINSGFHASSFFADLWLTILKGEVWRNEVKNKAKDGTYFWADTTIVPFMDEEGKPYQFIAIRKDITKRKKVEEEFRKSEEKFRFLFQNAPLGISITSIDGKLFPNKAFCSMLGYSENELKSMDWKEITHPDDIELTELKIQEIIKSKKSSFFLEKRYLHKNKSIVFAEVSISLQHDNNGNPINFIVLFNDITEKKNKEIELLKAFIEGEENEQKRIAAELHDGVGQLLIAANIHISVYQSDIKNTPKEENELLLTNIKTLISEALTETRNISHNLSSSLLEEKNLNTIINEMIEKINQNKKLNIKFIHYNSIKKIEWNIKINIYRILQELISNILKYANATTITIQLKKQPNKTLILSVEDNGIGFDKNKIKKNGIGLKNIASRVKALNGCLIIGSTIGEGTTIFIGIPLNPTFAVDFKHSKIKASNHH